MPWNAFKCSTLNHAEEGRKETRSPSELQVLANRCCSQKHTAGTSLCALSLAWRECFPPGEDAGSCTLCNKWKKEAATSQLTAGGARWATALWGPKYSGHPAEGTSSQHTPDTWHFPEEGEPGLSGHHKRSNESAAPVPAFVAVIGHDISYRSQGILLSPVASTKIPMSRMGMGQLQQTHADAPHPWLCLLSRSGSHEQ